MRSPNTFMVCLDDNVMHMCYFSCICCGGAVCSYPGGAVGASFKEYLILVGNKHPSPKANLVDLSLSLRLNAIVALREHS